MKDNKEHKNKSGWYEDADPMLGKAKRHSEVAARKKFENTLRVPLLALLKHEDKDENEEIVEEIVEEVQDRRKESAKAKDNAKTAEKVGDKENPEDLVDWVKNPNESDLEGVDDNQPELQHVKSGPFKGCLKVDESELDTKRKR